MHACALSADWVRTDSFHPTSSYVPPACLPHWLCCVCLLTTVGRMTPAKPCCLRPMTTAGRRVSHLPSASQDSTDSPVVPPLAHLLKRTQSYKTFADLLSKENYMKQVWAKGGQDHVPKDEEVLFKCARSFSMGTSQGELPVLSPSRSLPAPPQAAAGKEY